MLQDRLSEFITLWVVIDPLGSLPIFLAATAGMAARQRNQTAVWAVGVALAVLTFFLVGGQLIFNLLEVPLRAFQIAGGIVLLIFALKMIFGPLKEQEDL